MTTPRRRRAAGGSAAAPQSHAPRSSPPSSSPPSSPSSASWLAKEEERKRKHRQLVKCAYYKKQNDLTELRAEERELTRRHSTLLRRSLTKSQASVVGVPRSSVALLHDHYVRITSLKERETRENLALVRRCDKHLAFCKSLRLASAAEKRERQREEEQRTAETRSPLQASKADADSPRAVQMTPMTVDACFEVIQPAYAEVRSFRSSRDLYSSQAQVLGWTHRYRLGGADGSKLQYSISKVFPSLTARELSDRGWTIMTTERLYQALHSRGMTSRLHSVQWVDEDNGVFCRELQRPGQQMLMKTLFLASRFQTPDGYTTIYRALDHAKRGYSGYDGSGSGVSSRELQTKVETAVGSVKWLDMFAWTSFENQSDGSGVQFHFGGEMKHFSADNARFWMLEVLLMALRWETHAVGPMFTLQG